MRMAGIEGVGIRCKKGDLMRMAESYRQRFGTVVILKGQPLVKIVVAATKGNGYLLGKAHGMGYRMTFLVQIRENAEPAGTVQHHTAQDQKTDNSSHCDRKLSHFGLPDMPELTNLYDLSHVLTLAPPAGELKFQGD